MRILAGAVSLLFIAIASDANALTPAEAQTLSLAELAKRVFGDAGLNMLDVERPNWGPAPPDRNRPPRFRGLPWPPSEPPPLNRLTFYGRAETAGFFDNPLCRATRYTVDFEQNGGVIGLQTETRYGFEGPTDPPQGSWSYEKTVQACAAATSTKFYLPAPDSRTALATARVRAAIVSEARGNGPLTFSLLCSLRSTSCDYYRQFLQRLDTADFSATGIVTCPGGQDDVVVMPQCYELRRDGCVHQLVRTTGGFDTMRRLVIRSVYTELGLCPQDPPPAFP